MKHSITSKFISLFIIGLFFILVPNFTKAADSSAEGITLSPPLTELTIQKGKQASGTIKLTNPLAKMVELYSSTADFLPQGETGGQRFLAPTSENRSFSLASWISLAKEKIALAPNQITELNYTISVPQNAEPCGHYGVVFLSSQPPQLETGKTQIAVGSQVGALFLVNIPETTPGQCTPSGTVETFTAPWLNLKTPVNFLTRIYNNGNVHFKPTGEIKIKNWRGVIVDSVKFNEDSGNVLPDSARRFENQWKPAGASWKNIGYFKAELASFYGTDAAKRSLTANLVFWIIPWWLFVILGIVLALVIYLIIRWCHKAKNRVPKYDNITQGRKRVILR